MIIKVKENIGLNLERLLLLNVLYIEIYKDADFALLLTSRTSWKSSLQRMGNEYCNIASKVRDEWVGPLLRSFYLYVKRSPAWGWFFNSHTVEPSYEIKLLFWYPPNQMSLWLGRQSHEGSVITFPNQHPFISYEFGTIGGGNTGPKTSQAGGGCLFPTLG